MRSSSVCWISDHTVGKDATLLAYSLTLSSAALMKFTPAGWCVKVSDAGEHLQVGLRKNRRYTLRVVKRDGTVRVAVPEADWALNRRVIQSRRSRHESPVLVAVTARKVRLSHAVWAVSELTAEMRLLIRSVGKDRVTRRNPHGLSTATANRGFLLVAALVTWVSDLW